VLTNQSPSANESNATIQGEVRIGDTWRIVYNPRITLEFIGRVRELTNVPEEPFVEGISRERERERERDW
jgi:2'-5' RNA ligase